MSKFETQAIRTQTERTKYSEHSTPIFLTSSFVFDDSEDMRASFAEENDKNIYSRFSNPTVNEFVDKMVLLEGGESGVAFSTGMSAIYFSLLALLRPGDHVLSCRSVFGSTHYLMQKHFPTWQVTTTYFNSNEVERLETLLQKNTKILFVETPTNPGLEIFDLEFLGQFAKEHNLIFVVDNCFATPYLQQPIKYGADISLHSATKLIDGQGRVLGGIAVGRKDLMREIYLLSRNCGPSLSPFNAWILSKSLETLCLRVEKHCQNAIQIAQFLEKHPQVKTLKYPFLDTHPQNHIAKKQMKAGGNIIAFEVGQTMEDALSFMDNCQMLSITANLGDSRTIITHPASSTHSKLSEEERLQVGITAQMIRMSVGLEHVDDIMEDVVGSFEKLRK